MRILSMDWWRGEVGTTYRRKPRSEVSTGWWSRRSRGQKVCIVIGALALLGSVAPKQPSHSNRLGFTEPRSQSPEAEAINSTKFRVMGSSDHPSLVRFGNVWSPRTGIVCGTAQGAVRAGKVWFVYDGSTLYQFTETDIMFANIHRKYERFHEQTALSDHVPGLATYRGYCE